MNALPIPEASSNKVNEDGSTALDTVEQKGKKTNAPLFISNQGQMTLATFFLLMGLPLLIGGNWYLGISCAFIAFGIALCNAMNQIAEEDKLNIQYNNMEAADISDELKELEKTFRDKNNYEKSKSQVAKIRLRILTALEVLAKKFSTLRTRKGKYHPHEMECCCQEAAYTAFRLFPDDDELIASALSLHALVAKDSEVRQRHLHEADIYGLNVPIRAMRQAMARAKALDNPPEAIEHRSADLQRKACLLLGALADEDSDMATRIVDEEGLDAIFEVLRWYRYHEEVAIWALWATFILCYDHIGNKTELFKLGGIHLICQVRLNIPHSLDVARHGIATLFDLLREIPESPSDIAQIRKIAMNAGLHGAVRSAMDEFPESMEIMMMSQEMLVATGFKGKIPQYVPIS